MLTPQEGALVAAEAIREALEYQERESLVGPLFPEAQDALDSLLAYIKQLEQQKDLGSAPAEGSAYASVLVAEAFADLRAHNRAMRIGVYASYADSADESLNVIEAQVKQLEGERVDIQASGDLDALCLLIETIDLNSLPDEYEVKVTVGFMRALGDLLDPAPQPPLARDPEWPSLPKEC